jgi:hypothetical protein
MQDIRYERGKACEQITLTALRSSHATLSSVVERTSSVFAPILISTTPLSFFNQIYGYYFLCIGVFDLEELLAEKRWVMVTVSLTWLSGLTVHMVNLVWGCDRTVAHAKATKNLLLKMSFAESNSMWCHQEV